MYNNHLAAAGHHTQDSARRLLFFSSPSLNTFSAKLFLLTQPHPLFYNTKRRLPRQQPRATSSSGMVGASFAMCCGSWLINPACYYSQNPRELWCYRHPEP